jgi:phosphatidylserine/phosphatidylglycerophosphate/cardiolipin synthase-like enzyme
MDELLDAIEALVYLVSPEKVQAIATRVRRTEVSKAITALPSVVGTPVASTVVERLAVAWQKTELGSDELASMLLAASHVYTRASSEQSIELVWTGPTTPFVSTRRTEQALLQVINSARQSIFITSFVAYEVPIIVEALNATSDRGVCISILLELSRAHGGSVKFDVISKMRSQVPAAKLYAWRDKADFFSGGCVHAKVAVADGKTCFITSANLTGHAMEKNIEAGILITGGYIPRLLDEHLISLVDTKLISPV